MDADVITNVQEPNPNVPPRVPVVLVHGLNISPHAMRPLASGLALRGHRVAIVGLTGHRGMTDEHRQVSAERWKVDLREALTQCGAIDRPVRLIGYSLGGLLSACVLADTQPAMRPLVERLVLLAPAIGVRAWARMGEAAARLVPAWVPLRSGVPRRYRASTLVGAHWYRALFDLHRSILLPGVREQLKGLPIQVFMSKRDEFISWDRLTEWAAFAVPEKLELIELISHNKSFLTPHHLIIDEPSLGQPQWDHMLERISDG